MIPSEDLHIFLVIASVQFQTAAFKLLSKLRYNIVSRMSCSKLCNVSPTTYVDLGYFNILSQIYSYNRVIYLLMCVFCCCLWFVLLLIWSNTIIYNDM